MLSARNVLCGLLLALIVAPARAEQSEVTIAQQYGVAFLPLMVMERDKLLEKHARAAGLGEVSATWVKVAGPSVMNDGVVSGAIQFISVGAPSLITLWEKTRDNVGVKGVSAMTTYPLYLNVRNPAVKSIKDFSDKDRIVVPSVKVSTQAIMLQMAAAKEFGDANYARLDPWTVGLSHPDGLLAITNASGGVDALAVASEPVTMLPALDHEDGQGHEHEAEHQRPLGLHREGAGERGDDEPERAHAVIRGVERDSIEQHRDARAREADRDADRIPAPT